MNLVRKDCAMVHSYFLVDVRINRLARPQPCGKSNESKWKLQLVQNAGIIEKIAGKRHRDSPWQVSR